MLQFLQNHNLKVLIANKNILIKYPSDLCYLIIIAYLQLEILS